MAQTITDAGKIFRNAAVREAGLVKVLFDQSSGCVSALASAL